MVVEDFVVVERRLRFLELVAERKMGVVGLLAVAEPVGMASCVLVVLKPTAEDGVVMVGLLVS